MTYSDASPYYPPSSFMSLPTSPPNAAQPAALSKLLCDLIDAKARHFDAERRRIMDGHERDPVSRARDRITEVCAQIDAAYPAVASTPPTRLSP